MRRGDGRKHSRRRRHPAGEGSFGGGQRCGPSQSKRDEKLGRELRKEDEERGRQWRLAYERCAKGKPLVSDNCGAFQQR